MDATLTLRLDTGLRQSLRARAAALGLSEAEVVRRAVEREVSGLPLRDRVGRLRGAVESPKNSGDAIRKRLRERNWRA